MSLKYGKRLQCKSGIDRSPLLSYIMLLQTLNRIAYLSQGGLSPLVLVGEDAEGDDPEHLGDHVLEVEHGVVSPTVGRPFLDADVADDGGHHLDGQLRLVVPHQLVHMDRENRHQTVQLGPSERSGMGQ